MREIKAVFWNNRGQGRFKIVKLVEMDRIHYVMKWTTFSQALVIFKSSNEFDAEDEFKKTVEINDTSERGFERIYEA